jgi:ATP-binding cassette subfamily B protein
MTALVSFERVFEVLDLEPMVTDRANSIDLPNSPLTITFENVHFSYPTANEISLASLESAAREELVDTGEIIKGISFEIPAGQMTALVGYSGSGKTSIGNLIPRLYDVSKGSIKINGRDVRDYRISSLRKAIGVVSQDSHMFHESISSNLRYANPDASEADLVEACKSAQIWDFVRNLPNGLNTIVGDKGHRLSGGEKQRLAIARLLLKSPRIVILDEATAHLDSENEALVQAALNSALRNRTSLVIAHRLSTIHNADQIIVLDSGKIIEKGNHEDLIRLQGAYADLYNRQVSSLQ